MDSILYMGVRITPDSQADATHPGRWLPHARLEDSATGAPLEAVSDDEACESQADADARALRLARRFVMKKLHQG
ncbi:MAG: hypothetical protein LBI66_01595 [Burkholderiaceae bacterium]|jgi:hypothetical protein|nr:hypothetical protein [Burkholderiaceae bacterium]